MFGPPIDVTPDTADNKKPSQHKGESRQAARQRQRKYQKALDKWDRMTEEEKNEVRARMESIRQAKASLPQNRKEP